LPTDIILAEAVDVTPFTAADKKALAKAESVIEKSIRSFVEVGQALANIRDSRLYRATHDTFEAYVSERWHWERRMAYGYIEAAKVQENVQSAAQLPGVEHARTLAPLSPEKQRELAPLVAGLTIRDARSLIQNLDKVAPESVKRVQALFKDEPEPENGFAAFRTAAEALDLQTLTFDELSEFAGILQALATAYKAERARR
jgi:hypothetical protein